jgi:hypothetical protein
MAVRWQATGTIAGTAGASTTVAWPTHLTDDIGVLIIETANEDATISSPSGWTQFSVSPQSSTGATSANPTRMTAFWKRATSGAESNVVTASSTNHSAGVIITFRGCITSGDPVQAIQGETDEAASVGVSITGVTTTEDDCEVLYVAVTGRDIASARYTSETNASLTSLTERHDAGSSAGNGGHIALWTGIKTTAGATGTLTGLSSDAYERGQMCVAFKVAGGGGSPVTFTQSILM